MQWLMMKLAMTVQKVMLRILRVMIIQMTNLMEEGDGLQARIGNPGEKLSLPQLLPIQEVQSMHDGDAVDGPRI